MKQPANFYSILFASMCGHYGFFLLQNLLILYMIHFLQTPAEDATSTFTSFTALMAVAPLAAGKFIDRNLDDTHAVFTGGLLLSAGLFGVALLQGHLLNLSLSFIICGNGLFLPGILSSFGHIYVHGDARRENAFLQLYAAINISAAGALISAPFIISYFGWQAALAAAGSAVLLGIMFLRFRYWQTSAYKPTTSIQFLELFVLCCASIAALDLLLLSTMMSSVFLISMSSLLFIYSLISLPQMEIMYRKRALVCIGMIVFSVICFTLMHQSATSITAFVDDHVTRTIGKHVVPVFYFMALNPVLIVILTPLLMMIWNYFKAAKIQLSIPLKFGIGTVLLGLGFLLLTYTISCWHSPDGHISYVWLVCSYILQTLGELMIVPVCLAVITDIAPKQMAAFMIGAWCFVNTASIPLANLISKFTITLPHIGKHHLPAEIVMHANVYGSLGVIALFSGMILLTLNLLRSSN